MYNRSKHMALLFALGMAVGSGIWLGMHSSRMKTDTVPAGTPVPAAPPAAAAPASAGADARPAPGRNNAGDPAHGLPPLPDIHGEKAMKQALLSYIEFCRSLPAEGLSKNGAEDFCAKVLVPAQKSAEACLKENPEDLAALYMYKYPFRSAAEMAYKAGGKDNPAVRYFLDQYGCWNVTLKGWQFYPFEEAVYQAYYNGHCKTFSLPESLEVLRAVRGRDYKAMLELHNAAGLGVAPQWPLEVFRQLYTYAGTDGGITQMAELCRLLPKGESFKGRSWCEIGYGSGKIFSSLRSELGPEAVIYGVEIDGSCKKFMADIMSTGVLDESWGKITFRDGEYSDCKMPPASVDVIHAGLIHIGDGEEKLLERDWLPLLESMKNALKPGGMVLIDDGGDPSIERVRSVMARAGFKEYSYYPASHKDPRRPSFVAAFVRP